MITDIHETTHIIIELDIDDIKKLLEGRDVICSKSSDEGRFLIQIYSCDINNLPGVCKVCNAK